MKFIVVDPFTIETQHGTATLSAGKVLELSLDQAARMGGKVKPLPLTGEGGDLPHYCEPGRVWCSEKLPGSDYPTGCLRIGCNHHQVQEGSGYGQG